MTRLTLLRLVMPVLVLFSAAGLNCFPVQNMNYDFYSPKSKQLYIDLTELSKQSDWTNLNKLVSDEMKNKYGIVEDDDDLFVGATLNINELYDADKLWGNGIKVGTRINDVVTVRIPLYAYLGLEMIDGIDYVQIDSETIPRNFNF